MAEVSIESEVTGTVWKVLVDIGSHVKQDETLMIIESMKMEIPVESTCDGIVTAVHVKEEEAIEEGQIVALVESS